jgi:uncharacterized iron-regulated membrane protein
MKKNSHYYIRKSHRYLGLFIGIQFLLWTVGGLYFSWNQLDEIHGDHLTDRTTGISLQTDLASPQRVLEKLKQARPVDSLRSLQLVQVLDTPVYQISYYTSSNGQAVVKTQLASAITGDLRPPLSQPEAVRIAQNIFSVPSQTAGAEYLKTTGPQHEYRGKPLPAWAIHFEHPSQATVYVAAELGTFQSIRHERWRVFDFLWMLHTMDYDGRDNFNNLLLRSFSVLGLITLLSGFTLYYISSPTVRKLNRRRRALNTNQS